MKHVTLCRAAMPVVALFSLLLLSFPPALAGPAPAGCGPEAPPSLPDGEREIEDLQSGVPGELPPGPVSVLAPGTDTSLCMSWEPTIAVDPTSPRMVAVSQFASIRVSFDGGNSFTTTLTAPGANLGGDPSLAFDSQGRLFITYLCSPGPGRDVCVTGYQCDAGNALCALLPGNWPVNVSVASGVGGANADKEWLAADSNPGSPYVDRLHVVWVRLDTNPWSIWASFSTDQGQNWSAAQQISAADEGSTWPPHVAVAPNGAVYAAWHSQTGFLDPSGGDVPDGVSGQVVLRRSDDGGASWQPRAFPYDPGEADATYNVQHEANGLIPGANMWLFGSAQPWILPDPLVAGRVFVVAPDDPDNDVDAGDASDIFISSSTDSGATWGAPIRVDQGPPGTFQIMPTAAINPVNGAIGVTWYDSRASSDANFDGIFELDLLGTFSTDAGLTWAPEVDFNDGRIDPALANRCRFCGSDGVANQNCGSPACPTPSTTRIGEYNGVAYGECTLHAAWADNAAPACGGDYDTWYDRDPQMGGDLADPVPACPPPVAIECPQGPVVSLTGSATASDNCDANPALGFADLAQPGNCPAGKIRQTVQRTWTAADAAGNSASCVQTIAIQDTTPPDVDAPPPLALECNAPGGVPGDDPQIEAWLALGIATDLCGPATLSDDAPALFPAGCPPGGAVTQVTFTGTDECANSEPDSSTVTVTDSTSPQLSCSVQTATLWPPRHGMVDVGFDWSASDVCDPDLDVSISVTSDEDPAAEAGSGGPVHCPDAVVGPGGEVLLRAERAGTGDGRVYRITVTATDACGNAAACSADVEVRKSQGSGPATDSGQDHDATDCDG